MTTATDQLTITTFRANFCPKDAPRYHGCVCHGGKYLYITAEKYRSPRTALRDAERWAAVQS